MEKKGMTFKAIGKMSTGTDEKQTEILKLQAEESEQENDRVDDDFEDDYNDEDYDEDYDDDNSSGYDYDDEPGWGSYDEYGGYNGYDDFTIDSAFDGDPEATWNID